MEYCSSFFEELDELVYISDLDTHKLIYMNRRLRQSLGYGDSNAYEGKKCYEVLQGRHSPCSFCTNSALQEGKFISWTHKNPVLNKRYLIKDTVQMIEGRRCRIEIAIDIDSEVVCNTPYYYARSETILNDCLQRIFSTTNPGKGVELVLEYLGQTFECDRAYVFEIGQEKIYNSYEWCGEGVMPQKDALQDIPISFLEWWLKVFQKNRVLVLEDLEDIREQHPNSYAILKPQNISSLAAGPISVEGRVVGFVGVDNPNTEMLNLIAPILNVIGYFVSALLRQRDLLDRLNTLSFRDSLTGIFNRNAMFEHGIKYPPCSSIGVVYCDITGLKQTNDSKGHSEGDQLIRHCCRLMDESLDTPWIYRTGGDEFVAVFLDCTQEKLRQNVQTLRERISQDKCHMAVGYAWSDQQPFHLEGLISQADKVMYQDKRGYYLINQNNPKVDRRRSPEGECQLGGTDSPFYRFLSATYHDLDFLFQAISQHNSEGYFCFGDVQKDLFYISDNMRDDFGYESNVVPGLLKEWASHISTACFQDMYRQAMEDMLEKKQSVLDLRYQVQKADGRKLWIHSFSMLKWDDKREIPLFLASRVTHQDDEFVVDPVTNFPRESAVLRYMEQLQKNKQSCRAIGFRFGSISELNNTRGRTFSDRLLQSISDEMMNTLADKMTFYRLEGMRCLAMVDPACKESREALVWQLRNIIEAGYRAAGLAVPHACSFAVMEFPQDSGTPEDFMENMNALLKVAKQDKRKLYVENSQDSIQTIRTMSNMALALSRDVLQGMEHFRVMIQPVVSTKTGQVVGGEVLLRWRFEDKDVSPAIFVPMLEKENLIQKVGRWVFEQAACSCVRLVEHVPEIYLTFNVSLHQLSDVLFTDFMGKTMAKYHLDGSHLVAEMTESCMDEQPEKLFHFVDACKDMGIRIALDDFGSGYSSLRMLLQYPSSIIKLDRSLLQEITESEDKMNFISSIVYACHRFGKKVCMEGVETTSQDNLIKECGCDMIQGYYYYRPMEVNDVCRLVSTPLDGEKQ
ncbi:bifunctional diguanylate cyclase/phosphodiesterase [Lawsonibacter sp. LCP25S3_G6]|uniref:bifunctional diguanylate cyclase/phosphodiesterase n=1 Tax=unclassified Lawsonibacter TaxID=2617946 RepID=UPI003F9A413F